MERQTTPVKQTNWWKWGFIALVAVLLVTTVTVSVKAFTPTKVTSTAKVATGTTNIDVALNKKQVNALADY